MRNYMDLGICSLGRRKLMAYLDTDEYYGVGPLQFNHVRLKYQKEMFKPDEKYRLVFLRVLKKDEPKFIEAMEDLKIKMLICGHTDYETHGGDLMDELEENLLRRKAG